MSCVWSKATYVDQLVQNLARKHGLAIYDPQVGEVTYPDGSTGGRAKTGMSRGARWILGSFALLFAAICVYSEQTAPSRAPLLVYVLAGFCGLIAVACFSRAWRGPAVRIIGFMVFFAYASYLVYELLREPAKPYWKVRATLVECDSWVDRIWPARIVCRRPGRVSKMGERGEGIQ